MARVAITVVTHQSAGVIGPCLDALAALTDVEVIVVDNASTDATCEEAERRGVPLIANPHNAGFAAAVNQGVRATNAPLILLLNPDARLETGLESLVACFDDPKTGGAGGLLLGADGLPQTGFMARNLPTPAALILEVLGVNRLWPENPVNWAYRCYGQDLMQATFVAQPPGAFFMFPRALWKKLGEFDERFWPVWFEDVDFCARLRAEGYSVRFNPAARALHDGGHSVSVLPLELKEKYWYGSLLEYAAKHFSYVAFRTVCVAVAVGAAGRAFWGIPRGGWKNFTAYGSVIRLSFAHFLGLRRHV